MSSVTRDRLGAWLLRCSPTQTDLARRFEHPVRSWCVADNYRSRLMCAGDEVLLWVSGRDPRFVRGIWGVGRITAAADETADGLRVGLHLSLRPEALVTDAELRARGLNDLEVQRLPQGSNPSWVTREQRNEILAMT